MKKSLLGLFGTLGLVSLVAVSGCGSSSSDGATTAEATASCNAYCDAYIAKACADPIYTTVDDCKSSECTIPATASAGCSSAAKTYYDCEKTQADLCADTGCVNQFGALVSACGN